MSNLGKIAKLKSCKILIFSTSRADFDLLMPVYEALNEYKTIKVKIVAFIDKGFPFAYKSKAKLDRNQIFVAISKNPIEAFLGQLIQKSFILLRKNKPNLILLLGDRFETLTIAQTSNLLGIPIVHLAGGEITEGAVDNNFRFAISKLSHVHFVTNIEYKKRLIQIGESKRNIHVLPPFAWSNFISFKPKNLNKLLEELKIPNNFEKYALVTLHPETMRQDPTKQIELLLQAVNKFSNLFCLFTASNSDPGGNLINRKILKYVQENSNRSCFNEFLGKNEYFSALSNFDFLIGNSSSAYTEGSFFPIFNIDIGLRQQGRIPHGNLVNVKFDSKEIEMAIIKFWPLVPSNRTSYYSINPSKKLAQIIFRLSLEGLFQKKFYDISV